MKFLAVVLLTVCLVEFSYQLPYGVKGSSNYPSSSTEVKYIHGTESQFGESQGGYDNVGAYAKGDGHHSSNNGGGQIIFRPDNDEHERSVHSNKNQGFGSSGIGSSNGVYSSGGHGISNVGANRPIFD